MSPRYDQGYERARLQALQDVTPHGTGPAADIGCFDGTTTQLLADHGFEPHGFDLDPDIVASARSAHPGLRFSVGSVAEANDLVPDRAMTSAFEVLEHLPPADQPTFVADLVAGTRRGGWVLLTTPARHSLPALAQRAKRGLKGDFDYDWWDPTHLGVRTVRDLMALVRGAGLTVVDHVGFHLVPGAADRPTSTRRPGLRRLAFDQLLLCRRD